MTATSKRRHGEKPQHPPLVPLRVLREHLPLTMAQFRDRVAENGIDRSESHLRNLELGHQHFTPEVRAAWARALGITPGDIILPENVNGNGDET